MRFALPGTLLLLLGGACPTPNDSALTVEAGTRLVGPADARPQIDAAGAAPVVNPPGQDAAAGDVAPGGALLDAAPDRPPAPPSHRLGVTVQGPGQVTGGYPASIDCPPACTATLAEPAGVTLMAEPETGAQFVEWQGGCTGSAPACQLALTADTTVTAVFRKFVLWQQPVERAYKVATGNDGVYVIGTFQDTGTFGPMSATAVAGNSDGFIVAFDASGSFRWLKTFGATGLDSFGEGVAVLPSGEVLFTGLAAAGATLDGRALTTDAYQDPFVAWIDPSGQILKLTLGLGGSAVTADRGGNSYVVSDHSTDHLYKFGPDRQMLWSSPSWPAYGVSAADLSVDPLGNIIICGILFSSTTINGRAYNSMGFNDAILIKHSPTGVIQWATSYGSIQDDYCSNAVSDGDGIYVSGIFLDDLHVGGKVLSNLGGFDGYAARFVSATGQLSWIHAFSGTGGDGTAGVSLTRNQLLVGVSGTFDAAPGHPVSGGALLWLDPATGALNSLVSTEDAPTSIALHPSGDVIYAGASTGRLAPP